MPDSADANIDPELQFPHASRLRQEENPSQSPHPYYFQQQRPSTATDLNDATPQDADESPGYEDDDDKDHHDDGDQRESQNNTNEAALDANGNPKRSRACDNCRRDKQKCEPSDDPSDPVCKRCKRGNKHCYVTPSVKKRQKKENNAVSKLQEEVAALKAMIQGMHSSPPTAPSPSNFPPLPSYGHSMGPLGVNSSSAYHTTSPGTDSTSHSHSKRSAGPSPSLWSTAESETLIDHTEASARKRKRIGSESEDRHGASLPEGSNGYDRLHTAQERSHGMSRSNAFDHSDCLLKLDQIVSPEASKQAFERYTKHIALRFPMVPIAPGTTAEHLRSTKPFLYLAIVSCSSFTVPNHLISPDDQVRLGKLFIDHCAEYIWRNAEKSFEIVQALQVGVLWYRPPSFEQHNFYTMANTAMSMALDLGSGKRASPMVLKMGIGPFRKRSPEADSLDGRRAFLVCYYMTINMTMVLRRPLLLHWSKYLEDCIQFIESSPNALPTDLEICYHVKIAHLAEEIIKEFKLEDPSDVLSLSDPAVIRSLRDFRARLDALKKERPVGNQSVFILTEQIVNLYLHEIALHTPQNADDFRPPFSGGNVSKSSPQISGNAHVDALMQCFVTCHGILDTFLGMPYEHRLVLPVIFSVRTIYGVVCLIKFWGAVTNPGNLSQLFRPEDLKVDYYLDRLIETFRSIVDRYPQAPHGKFYAVASSLKDRFKIIKEGGSRGPDGSIQFGCHSNGPSSQEESRSPMPPPSQTLSTTQQTPLHLLSEVAMGNPTPHQQQMQSYHQQTLQQQQQQQPSHYIDPAYNVSDQGFGPNDYDFSLIDFNSLGMLNTDLSSLFMWDPSYNLGYIGEMGQAMGSM